MYQQGDIEIVTEQDYDDMFGTPDEGEERRISDARQAKEALTLPYVQLPHSCDAWVIGGAEQIKAMIVDLQAALAKVQS